MAGTVRKALAAVAVTVAVFAGVQLSRATSPCRPFLPVDLTGTLVEIRRDDTVVPADDPIRLVLPPAICVGLGSAPPDNRLVKVSDCDDPQFNARFLMETP